MHGTVLKIILRPLLDRRDLLVGELPHHLGRLAEHQRARRNLHVFGDQGLRPDDAVRADVGVIHDRGPHPHQHLVLDGAPVNDGPVPDGDPGAYVRGGGAVRYVDDSVVLHVRLRTNPNPMDVAAQRTVVPDAGAGPEGHVAHQDGRLGDIVTVIVLGMLPQERLNHGEFRELRSKRIPSECIERSGDPSGLLQFLGPRVQKAGELCVKRNPCRTSAIGAVLCRSFGDAFRVHNLLLPRSLMIEVLILDAQKLAQQQMGAQAMQSGAMAGMNIETAVRNQMKDRLQQGLASRGIQTTINSKGSQGLEITVDDPAKAAWNQGVMAWLVAR